MSLLSPYVYIYFNETASFGTAFVLDDSVQGVLDGTTYTLATSVPVDVTSYVSGSITTTRGRSRQVDQFQAGSMTFTLRNEDRAFDPSNTASPTGSALTPRLIVEAGLSSSDTGYDIPIFTGYIDDIDVHYEIPNISEVTITCIDAFSVLSNIQLNNVSVPSGLPGAVMNSVLSSAKFAGQRNIATGYNTIQSSTQSSTDALTFLQTIARSDNGMLFVDHWGTLTFFDRFYTNSFLGGGTTIVSITDDTSDLPNNPNALPYIAINQKSQALLLYNKVTGTRTGGTQQSSGNASSQAAYQVRELALGQLENSTDATVADLTNFMVNRYAQPEVRFDSVQISLNSLLNLSNSVNRQQVLQFMEIGDVVSVTRTPSGSGTPATLTKYHSIDGISWTLDASTQQYSVLLNLASMQSRTYLVLDDAYLGILETSTNRLGY